MLKVSVARSNESGMTTADQVGRGGKCHGRLTALVFRRDGRC